MAGGAWFIGGVLDLILVCVTVFEINRTGYTRFGLLPIILILRTTYAVVVLLHRPTKV